MVKFFIVIAQFTVDRFLLFKLDRARLSAQVQPRSAPPQACDYCQARRKAADAAWTLVPARLQPDAQKQARLHIGRKAQP